MTKIEMLDKLDQHRSAVEMLPDGAEPISISIGSGEYILLSNSGETPLATHTTILCGKDQLFKRECKAYINDVPVVWLEA